MLLGIIAKLLLTTNRATIKLPRTTPMSLTPTCFTPPSTPRKPPRLTPKRTVANPKPLRNNAEAAQPPL